MPRPKKCWSFTAGKRGYQVTAYERELGGPLWLRWWAPGAGRSGSWRYRSLKHRDQTRAEAAAREIAGQLLAATVAAEAQRATVAEIFAAYEHDVARHLKGQGPKEAKRRIAIWTHVLGANRDAYTVDFPTLTQYIRDRRAGAIKLRPYELAAEPSDRAIGADFTLLQAAFNHATRVIRSNGTHLLTTNPIAKFQAPRKNTAPKRPVATYDRFLAVLKHADAVDPQRLFAAFLELVEGLGWRVSAICGLRASDVDRKASKAAPHGRIHKRGETDKQDRDAWIPMSRHVRAAIDRVLSINPALGERPLFPAPKARTSAAKDAMPKSWSRHHARALLERAESAAKLDALDGGDFHPFRRKWATERKHLPAKDVAAAGQWSDLRTLETAYTQTDEATLLAVVTEPRKLRAVNEEESAS